MTNQFPGSEAASSSHLRVYDAACVTTLDCVCKLLRAGTGWHVALTGIHCWDLCRCNMETLISWALDNGASFEAAPSAEQPRQLYAARDLLPGGMAVCCLQHMVFVAALAQKGS